MSREEFMIDLGVNIDHVATLRQARGGKEPDPVWAVSECELAGAQSITVHLREDRRHIQDRDVFMIREIVQTKLNLEMASTHEMVQIALKLKPDQVTLVPEKRKELTTEGGLNIQKNYQQIEKSIIQLTKKNIPVSLFIDPDLKTIQMSQKIGGTCIELHTGRYVNNPTQKNLDALIQSAQLAHELNLKVHAGHGINYQNIHQILMIPFLKELNIGHSIISRAIFTGLQQAVKQMRILMNLYPKNMEML